MAKGPDKRRPLTDTERAGVDSENRGRPVANPSQVPAGRTRGAARALRDRGRQIDDIVESQVTRR
jgi:hypothetical protein